MAKIGKNNALTDIKGIRVGQYTDTDAVCGTTVVICPEGAVAGVDVRGSSPGTRETDLLSTLNLVKKVQAVVLSGGSVFGLAAADGVVQWLADKGFGFPLDKGYVAPIVPAAVLYDLGRGPDFIPTIDAGWGLQSCQAARGGSILTGSVGAGTGALSGGIKGGLGTASLILDAGITVAALVAVNSYGSAINPLSGRPWEIETEMNGEFGDQANRAVKLPPPLETGPAQNTTIGLVATDATLTKSQAQKIAQMAHDGLARAIRPAHTMFDGDTIFCLATGKRKLPEVPGFFDAPQAQAINDLGQTAADCVTRAIMRAILSAHSLAGMTAFRDLEDR
ncbi:MAG: P1 family peptidase [Deltaproteobacteria bacterium]|nr:MAG: P1 family peptidase [Deltaproteobacteria bacterium]